MILQTKPRAKAANAQQVPNVIAGKCVRSRSPRSLAKTNPSTGEVIARVPLSTAAELAAALPAAQAAQRQWAAVPVKDRVQVLYKFKRLLEDDLGRLAGLINRENGKTVSEARASIARGVECVEYAASLPMIGNGQVLEVGRGVECKMLRFPLGVVAGITPFNFPLMVPLWMAPLALACGNAFILKPSEQAPLSAVEMAKLLKAAGLPDGLFSVLHGGRDLVEAICDHPDIKAVGFVGSTPVAKAVYRRASAAGKRVRALGGAKNHLVLVPDADPKMAAQNIVDSVTGCCGQRCMAASVLLAIGEVDHVIAKIQARMAALVPGRDLGPLITSASRDKIAGYLARAEKKGARLLLDGRKANNVGAKGGYFLGASIIDRATATHEAARDEIFGPVLTIIRCKTLDEALAIENANPFGNAAAIYTGSGRAAQQFVARAAAGMVGVNIGVPVPREPFPFGGWHDSRFGDGDLTGAAAIDFWSASKKVTTKWEAPAAANWMS